MHLAARREKPEADVPSLDIGVRARPYDGSRSVTVIALIPLISLFLQFARVHLVHIAPDPVFSRFNGTNERMSHFLEVFGGVLVFG